MSVPIPSVHTTPVTRRVLLLGTVLSVAVLVALLARTAPSAPNGSRDAGHAPSRGILPAVVVPGAGRSGCFEARAADGTVRFATGGGAPPRAAGHLPPPPPGRGGPPRPRGGGGRPARGPRPPGAAPRR